MKSWTLEQFIEGFKRQDTNALARAITLVESTLPVHRRSAQELLKNLTVPSTTRRIGISGTPGVGKSTFIESFGALLTSQGLRVAVLAVDPTSQVSGGSILGDKTRMETLARNPRAFIRPSPSGGSLGGVARRTREVIHLCEAFGFDRILVETVGVGQSETAVARMVDCFVMLLQPGAGDDLQGIKRGILELVDLVVVTKSDGTNKIAVTQALHHYQQALHILRQTDWHPPVLGCSAWEQTGFSEIQQAIDDYYQHLGAKLEDKRSGQRAYWLDEALNERLREWFAMHAGERLPQLREAVVKGELPVGEAVERLLAGLPNMTD